MIEQDFMQQYDPDCSTCAHRVERHPSKRTKPSKPMSLSYVCLVCAKAIGEHGCWTQRSGWDPKSQTYRQSMWVQDVPCKKYDKEKEELVALDWERRKEG